MEMFTWVTVYISPGPRVPVLGSDRSGSDRVISIRSVAPPYRALGEVRTKKRESKAEMSSGTGRHPQVRASHILIKHAGSRRKASWKDPDGTTISATTRDSAVAQLRAFRDDIVAGRANFEDVAKRHSDCSSAKRGGDLGYFQRGQMQKPFEDATFALEVGSISDIVDTDSGVHIILRTG